MNIGDNTTNNISFIPQPPAVFTLEIPGPGGDSSGVEGMNENDYGAIKMRLLESMTASQDRRTAGADLYAENLRYDYLVGKARVSFSEGTAQRMVTESGSGKARQLQ